MDGPIVEEFTSSAQWLARLATEIPADAWDRLGLGVWDVRSLFGHAARAVLVVEEYLRRPAESVEVPSSVDYLLLAGRADPAAIAARGVNAGADLGDEPVAGVATMVERVLPIVARTPPDAVVATAVGGMTLESYLPTRTVELVVHGCDLAATVGLSSRAPAAAAASTARLLTEAHLRAGRADILCLGLAGRPMPPGSFVLWPS